MLYTPNYDEPSGRYCGPTAICAITGVPLSEAKAAIRQASGRLLDAAGRAHRVSGVNPAHIAPAMALCGWRLVAAARPVGRLRFRDFLAQCGDGGPYIVNVPGHYIAVGGGEVCDTFNVLPSEVARYVKRKPGRGRYGGSRVVRFWRFERAA